MAWWAAAHRGTGGRAQYACGAKWMHLRVLTERRTHGLADEMAGPAENDSTEASATGAPQPPPARIAFFGNFGTQNLGNEYTLKSIIHNVRRRLPEAELSCICTDPEDASVRHGLPALRISYRFSREFLSRSRRSAGHPVLRILRRLLVRMPREFLELLRAYRTLKGVSTVVMTGTGMLSDFGIGPLDLHYEILKWSVLAKLRGAKLMFVSVGVGPLAEPVSRWIVKRALRLADYRSYRDPHSKAYLQGIGFDSSMDRVYPDLAFSLPPQIRAASNGGGRVVGIGLMDYYGTRASRCSGEEACLAYINKMAKFVSWLLERGYQVHLLIGDVSYDQRSKADILKILRESGKGQRRGQVVDVPVTSVEQLVEAIARTDIVVGTRFHTVLLSLMLQKPVLALSYHQKTTSLMDAMRLSQYCHDVDGGEDSRLIEQFIELEGNRSAIARSIAEKTADCGRALEEQYEHLFGRS
jgi:polysaccharide pyruvyl transferase WcaK-like protein